MDVASLYIQKWTLMINEIHFIPNFKTDYLCGDIMERWNTNKGDYIL